MYCDAGANSGATIEWNNRNITVRIGLQCGIDKMWMKKDSMCAAMNATVKDQLLKNYNFFTKDLGSLPDESLSIINSDRQIGNLEANWP